MPPMGQGEDPNDPNRQLTYDERKKHEESETFGMEILSIREGLPREVREIIAQHLRDSYEEDILHTKTAHETIFQTLKDIRKKSKKSNKEYRDRWEGDFGRPIEPRNAAERENQQEMLLKRQINKELAWSQGERYKASKKITNEIGNYYLNRIPEILVALRSKDEPTFYYDAKKWQDPKNKTE